eukprot:scaffold118260_cov33-Tisochrysis_lutea.AAC.1
MAALLLRAVLLALVAVGAGSPVGETAASPPSEHPPCFVNGMKVDPSLCISPPPPSPNSPSPLLPPHTPPPPPEAPMVYQNPYVMTAAGVGLVAVGGFVAVKLMSGSGGVAMS